VTADADVAAERASGSTADDVEHPDVPVNPEEPGTSGLPDPQPDKDTEQRPGNAPGPVDPESASTGEEELAAAEAAVAEDVDELAKVAAERDEYLAAHRHLQADFENFRKRVHKEQAAAADRGAEALVRELLPVLDAADLARAHDETGSVQPVVSSLTDALAKVGVERVDPQGEPFDPSEHEAVMHEPGDGEPEVLEVLRAGYRLKGRVLRPAMVKVKGS
jgi:molecular chaperone GrpE